jgi:hypothetical protein
MNHEQLLEKLGNAQVNLNPAMHDLMQRVREVGLHKVAAHTHRVSKFTLKTAAWYIGKELTRQHMKFSKIASGIRALQALDQSGEISLEKIGKTVSSRTMARLVAERVAKGKAQQAAAAAKSGGPRAIQDAINMSAESGGVSEAAQLLKEVPKIMKGRQAIPPPIPPAALRQRPPMPEMIGGMAAGPGAAMGGGGGAPMSRAAHGRQSLGHVLTPIDFAKMAQVFHAHA